MVPDDRYRLAPLRDSRTRDERVRRGELADAAAGARETEGHLAAARARTSAAREAVARAVAVRDATTSAGARVLAERHVSRMRAQLADRVTEELRAQATHDARLGTVDEARLVLARARADKEVIERHFRRWRDERRKLAERREE